MIVRDLRQVFTVDVHGIIRERRMHGDGAKGGIGTGKPAGKMRALPSRRREMKTLFLIRHAKSSWDHAALPDKDRPLNDRGKRDAPKMGKRLAKRDVKPDLILSSPARRARHGGDHRQEAQLQAQGYRGG